MPRTNTNTTTDVATLTDVVIKQVAHDTGDVVASTGDVVSEAVDQCLIIDKTDKVKANNNQVAGGFRIRVVVSVSTMSDDQKSKFRVWSLVLAARLHLSGLQGSPTPETKER